MLDPKVIKTYLHILTTYSKKISRSSRSILTASGVLFWVAFLGIVLLTMWEGRATTAQLVYRALSSGAEDVPVLIVPWNLVPVEEFPEFWSCDKKSCEIDRDKQIAVDAILNRLRGEVGALRSIYSVYGGSYRRVAAQTSSPGNREISEELWIVPLSQDGFDDNILNHARGQCNSIVIADLAPGSMLRIEAPAYNLAFGQNCPVDVEDMPYQLRGYVAVDFAKIPDNIPKVTTVLRQAAEDIEAVMGYDRATTASD